MANYTKIVQKDGTSITINTMVCHQCGSIVPLAKYCGECGNKFDANIETFQISAQIVEMIGLKLPNGGFWECKCRSHCSAFIRVYENELFRCYQCRKVVKVTTKEEEDS